MRQGGPRRHLEEYMAAVETRGGDYGLKIHWGRVCLPRTGTQQQVKAPDGSASQPKNSMLYLGALIDSGGAFGGELNRKLGAA